MITMQELQLETLKAAMRDERYDITHSGCTFTNLGWAVSRDFRPGSPLPVWPIEEYLARTNHSPRMKEKLRTLNPNGKTEGDAPRGWHPHARTRSGYHDHCGVQRFNAKWGKGAHRKLRRDQYRRDGKRMLIPGITFIQGPPQ